MPSWSRSDDIDIVSTIISYRHEGKGLKRRVRRTPNSLRAQNDAAAVSNRDVEAGCISLSILISRFTRPTGDSCHVGYPRPCLGVESYAPEAPAGT